MTFSTILYFIDAKAYRRIETALGIEFKNKQSTVICYNHKSDNNYLTYKCDKYYLDMNGDCVNVEFYEFNKFYMLSVLNAISDALLLDMNSFDIIDEDSDKIISIMNEKISLENHIHDMMLEIFHFKFSFKSVTADTYDRINSALITFHDCDVLEADTDDIRVGKCDYIKFHVKLNVFWASNSMFKPIL
jgi:hypothetical protein